MISNIKERWKAFCEWQQRPYQLSPMSEEHHRCFTCGQEYQGNFCPHCGQSARIGRYSLRNALLLFLDVWGVGNRGMFRTLRDLLLRPGYMIRDYISGMQMAYFPPFKLLFLLVALHLVVDSGVNVKGINYFEERDEHYSEKYTDPSAGKKDEKELTTEEQLEIALYNIQLKLHQFMTQRQAFYGLIVLLLLTGPLYFFFRKSPAIPDLRFSELLVALVYTYSLIKIFDIVFKFFTIHGDVGDLTFLLPIIPLKQMSGFPWWKTILFVVLSYIILLLMCFGLMCIAVAIELLRKGVI